MIGATLYIIVCSARNRIRVRLRRLREPRYLIGAIVGVAYIYFSFFARFRSRRAGRRRAGPAAAAAPALLHSGSAAVGLLLFAGAALGWIVPFNSSMLEFSNAEMAFLFPAPVSRRALIVHRLMRSQLGLLFTAAISSLVFSTAAWPARLRFVVAMWILLTSARVYFTGVTLTRTRLIAASREERRIAWIPAAVVTVAAIIVGHALVRAYGAEPPDSMTDLIGRIDAGLGSPAARVVLWPFVALARPMFVSTPIEYVVAIVVALGVLGVTALWVLLTDDALEEAAAAAAANRAAVQQLRAVPAPRARATGLTLAPSGRPEGVFFWKNGVQTLRAGGFTLIRYIAPVAAIATAGTSLALSVLHLRGGAAAGFMMAASAAGFAAVLGPQVVRTDLRSDLRHLEVLKTWPLHSAAIVRGEMLWPTALLVGLGWLAIACAAMLSFPAFPAIPLGTRIVAALTAMLLLPGFVAAQYLVHAAAAVLFPAWVPSGDQRPRGLDAMGQRLIMLAAVLVSVTVLLLPGAVTGGIMWLVLQPLFGIAVFVPAAAVCSSIVLLEVTAGTEALGPLFEKLDVLAIERSE